MMLSSLHNEPLIKGKYVCVQITAEELTGNDDYIELSFSARKLDDKVKISVRLFNTCTRFLTVTFKSLKFWIKHSMKDVNYCYSLETAAR